MKPSRILIQACRVLRSNVRFEHAGFCKPGSNGASSREYTEEVRQATKIYTESWIVPIIDAIECGDMGRLNRLISGHTGQDMEEPR